MTQQVQHTLATIAAHLDAGRLEDAQCLLDQVMAAAPDNPDAHSLQSDLYLRAQKPEAALDALARALALDPGNPHRLVLYARCQLLAGHLDAARNAATDALGAGASRPDHLTLLGAVFTRCDDHQQALTCFDAALKQAPDTLEAMRGRATVLRFLGRNGDAEQACDHVLARTPHDYEIQNLRSSLRRQTSENNHVNALLAVLKEGAADWRGAVQIAYALAKELEDLGEYDAAFHHLSNGADIRDFHTRYDVADDLQIFDAIKAACTPDALSAATNDAPGGGCNSAAPIFILGMPRTGSTLVERIVSSHSDVEAAGELNDFALQLVSLTTEANAGGPVARLDLPARALHIPHRELGERYLAATRAHRGSAPHFIDKLPLNFLYIGFIHLALPNAKIVHVKRHPLDACFAMYKYLFKQAYPFSYNLEKLARYYAGYFDLMAHWRTVLPEGRLIEIDYEALVGDQEGQTRWLLDRLGLDWQDACLQFHKNPNASTTGSASQVREKLYASSVGKWQAYRDQLAPLIAELTRLSVPVDAS